MKILIAEDHVMMRVALVQHLRRLTGHEFVEAGNGLEALNYAKSNSIDLAILDVNMPIMDGRKAFAEVKKINPQLKTIILTCLTGEENLMYFIHHKADGFISKFADIHELVKAIEVVLGGKSYFQKETVDPVRNKIQFIESGIKKLNLTSRESELLRNLQMGLSNKEISDQTGLSLRTIESYRDKLFEKTGTRNSAELISFAIKNGITII